MVIPELVGHYRPMSNDPCPTLETQRLKLRCVAVQDGAATAALMTPDVSRWLASWPLPFTKTMAENRILEMRAEALLTNVLPYAVIVKEEAELAGWVILAKDVLDLQRGALGYWMGQPYQRQGFAREVIAAVLPLGFERLHLNVIEAGAQEQNLASFAVMRACGMVEVGNRMVYAPARKIEELCNFYEIRRSP